MMKSLSIRNYALIEELTVDFTEGLIIVTGETGAGKSIIIDALGLILGERASAEVVRTGAEKAIVEGVFCVGGNKTLQRLLEDHELQNNDELILRRELTMRGQTRCFINDSPATAAVLKQVGDLLVDLHGQHDHQSLLRPETHVETLDEFGGLAGHVEDFQHAFRILNTFSRELAGLRRRKEQLQEKREFYEFQLKEIDAVAPQSGEEEQLEAERRILENAEQLAAATSGLYQKLYEGEQSIHDLLAQVRNELQQLTDIDKQFEEPAKESVSGLAIVSELAKFIQAYHARIEFSPERLEFLRERLGRLAHLKKKYGGSLESVLSHREKIGGEFALAENFDEVIAKLSGETENARRTCAELAQRISSKRMETARKLDKAVVAELAKLGIRHAKFSTTISQHEAEGVDTAEGAASYVMAGKKRLGLNTRGIDEVEFLISTNLGEEVKPLVKVASGGEVSRIMLALKSILAKSDRTPVLIFDEIDVGVSGRVAQAVGRSLKELSRSHQVIAITHLPQIAGLADTHFVVFKTEEGQRARSAIRRLSAEERVHEVAKLMSGAQVTEAGLVGAKELMGLQ